MAIDFPASPTLNQQFTSGGTTWIWNGTSWNLYLGGNIVTTASLSSTLASYAPVNSPTISGTATFVNKPTIPGYQDDIPYQSSAPSSPSAGDYYVNSSQNQMYVYVDGTTGWVAISVPPASPTFTGTVTAANMTLSGVLTVAESTEVLDTGTISSNLFTANFNTSSLFYITAAPTANFTINVTNLPTTDNRVTVLSFFVIQGSTGYIPSAIQIGGSGQTLKWSGGSAPTPTSGAGKVDVFTFTFIRRSSAWEVLGTSDTNY